MLDQRLEVAVLNIILSRQREYRGLTGPYAVCASALLGTKTLYATGCGENTRTNDADRCHALSICQEWSVPIVLPWRSYEIVEGLTRCP